MDQQDTGGTTKTRIAWYVFGGIAVVVASAVATYLALATLYNAQEALPSDEQATKQDDNLTNRTLAASSHRDFGAVCGGFTVSNATPYATKSTAVIVTFSQSPRTDDSWSYEDVGYGKTYTRTDGDFTKITTVACLHEIRDTKVFAKECQYVEDEQKITVRYYSIRYKLSYYEATTGERIADGGTIEAVAGDCPSFVAYDPQTLTAYAVPANDAIDIAHRSFVGAP